MTITGKRLAEIREREGKATPGEMEVLGDGRQVYLRSCGMIADCGTQWADDGDDEGGERDWNRGIVNAQFYAHARADVPDLLDLVEEMRDVLKRAHRCATMKDDRTCDGCEVGNMLRRTEEPK